MSEPDYQKEMELPEGKTCSDCYHAYRCTALGYSKGDRTSCDFYPSRYREAPAAAQGVLA